MDYIGNYMKREYLDTGELPPIIPVLIYQARDSEDSGLIDLVDNFADLSRDIKRYQVIFEVVEFKLTDLTWQEVSSRMIKIYSLAATMETAADEINRLEEIASALAALAEKKRLDFVRRKLVSLSEYILTVTELNEERIRDIIEAKLPGGGDIVESTAERLRKEGMEKGRKEGRKKGRKEGMAKGRKDILDLMMQMREKFGEDSLELIEVIKDKDEINIDEIKRAIAESDDIEELRRIIE
ncbi:hypothetical protein SAMN04488692_11674 [Halarsenatibacter silvermanii]|uniref:Transposase, YhgA-like n=1 Tax=Halarsenatibacter silvermanii TaxID=321763 RepID=A0A1G9QGJ5_9FIRM|nr:hypothetical protein SAMN04488692_11674 [Halarsenatibacter silvermanii]